MVGTWRKSRVESEETDTGRCGEGECTWERGWRRDRLGVGKWKVGDRVDRERESEILVGVGMGDMFVTDRQTDTMIQAYK